MMNANKPVTTRKRTHLKPSQVAVLQEIFVNNTLPDTSVRAQLAQELDVTERTVQIWFQNRRAKAKKLEELSPGTTTSSLAPNVRTGWIYMPHSKPYETKSIKSRPRSTSKPESSVLTTFSSPKRAASESTVSHVESSYKGTNNVIVPFPMQSIRIGSWARFSRQIGSNLNEWDLYCYSDTYHRQFIWQVKDGGHQFRIEVSYDMVQQIRLCQVQQGLGQLELMVHSPVSFSMQRHGVDTEWVRCNDFTEHQQASQPMAFLHVLQGPHDGLRQSLLELLSLAPELATKLIIAPHSFLVSPSGTPEPNLQTSVAAMQYYSLMTKTSTAQPSLVEQQPQQMQPQQLQPQIQQQPEPQPQQQSQSPTWQYLPLYPQRQQFVHAPHQPTGDVLSSFL